MERPQTSFSREILGTFCLLTVTWRRRRKILPNPRLDCSSCNNHSLKMHPEVWQGLSSSPMPFEGEGGWIKKRWGPQKLRLSQQDLLNTSPPHCWVFGLFHHTITDCFFIIIIVGVVSLQERRKDTLISSGSHFLRLLVFLFRLWRLILCCATFSPKKNYTFGYEKKD